MVHIFIYVGSIFISRDPQLFIWKVCRVLSKVPCPRIFIQVTLDARDFPFTFEVERFWIALRQGGPPTLGNPLKDTPTYHVGVFMGGKKNPQDFFLEHQLNNMGTLLYTQLSLDCGVLVFLVGCDCWLRWVWLGCVGCWQSTTEN